jgi:hypothetical protein
MMSVTAKRQFCAVCAWRENCAKKFCVADGGAHCPDFTRDIAIRDDGEEKADAGEQEQQ